MSEPHEVENHAGGQGSASGCESGRQESLTVESRAAGTKPQSSCVTVGT